MQSIDYRRHFLTLIPAAICFWVITRDPVFSRSGFHFFLYFGSMGTLHATSLVVSLRERNGVTIGKACIFVTLVSALSILVFFSPLLFSSLLALLPRDNPRFFAGLALASVVGASGYWLLLRWFWLKSRSYVNLITTSAVCGVATLVSWTASGDLAFLGDIAGLVPTLAWWAAFSLSLYFGDIRGQASRRLATARN